MNIGIVTTWFERGAAYVSRAYMDTLSKEHNIFIYARAGERYAKDDPKWNNEYVVWGKKVPDRPPTYVDWKDFESWVSKNDLQAVIFNEQHSWEVIIRAQKLNISLGMYVDYYTPKTVPFFWIFDFLLCNTKRHYSVFKDHPHAIYIPWGTDIDLFKPGVKTASDKFVRFFHSCGVDPRRKGTDVLVPAFQKLNGNAKLIIHSQGKFEEHPPRFRLSDDMLSSIRRDPRIEVIEKEVGAPGLYNSGDVYIYPSRLEGIGLTIAEALASGLPVITTDAPPMNEFIVNEFNGKLVAAEIYKRRDDNYYWPLTYCSEAALREDMQFFVDNPHLVDTYKKHAREYAEEHLDWKKNSSILNDFIKNTPRAHARFDKKLIRSIMRHEKRSGPYTTLWGKIKNILWSMGVRKIKIRVKPR